MKMARASEDDLKAALDVSRIIENELAKGYMPSDDDDDSDRIEWFDRDDPDQCKVALNKLLDAAEKGSLFRVFFGMTVLLDPRNKLTDPDADTLEAHPDIVAQKKAARFAGMAFKAHRNDGYPGDLDGDALQRMAIECGLLEERQVTESCGVNCSCADVGEFPATCYFNTHAARIALDAAEDAPTPPQPEAARAPLDSPGRWRDGEPNESTLRATDGGM